MVEPNGLGVKSGPHSGATGAMISLEHAKQALLRSGYLLENRVESLLVRRGYGVQANTPFLDTISEKERELDLHALRLVSAGPAEFDFVWSVLLIECVNNPQPIAFVTKDSDLRETEIYRIKMAGVPTRIIDPQKPGRWILLADYLGMSRYHHYCKGRTATQFCSFSQKKGSNDWMASHIDEHWDDLGKVIRALEHFRSDLFDCWRPPSRKRQPDHINVEIYYPLVVLQGELLDVQQSRTALHIRPAKHMQYTRSTLSAGRESFYQIDVVTERYLPRYLTIIEEELERTGRLLRRRQKHVRKSLNRLVTAASRYRSPDRIRSALEPAAHFLE